MSTTPTTLDTNAHDDRATRIERRLVRAILTPRAACTAATVAGWYPSDGDTALHLMRHLMRLGGMAHVALKGLAGVPTCPACDEPYGYHPPSCALAPYLRAAVERASGWNANPPERVLRDALGQHPHGGDGAYLVCAPDPAYPLATVPHTALLVGFVDLDALPTDTFVWPVSLPVTAPAAPAAPPSTPESDAQPPDEVARFVAAYRSDPGDVLARLSRNPLRT